MSSKSTIAVLAGACLLAACGRQAATLVAPTAATSAPMTAAPTTAAPTTAAPTTAAPTTAAPTTAAPTTAAPTTAAPTTAAPTTAAPTTAAPTTAAPTTAAPTTAAPTTGGCSFSAEAMPSHTLMGNTKVEVVLKDDGSEACDLQGPPTVIGIDANGAPVSLQPEYGETYFGQPEPQMNSIPPGGQAAIYLTGSVACPEYQKGARQTWSAFELTLPDGETARFTSDLDTTCRPVYVSRFGGLDPAPKPA